MDSARQIKVWDPLVRVFHWTLVTAFVIAYMTEDDWMRLHANAGYVITGLLVFRLIWGFVGPRHARFSDFVFSPRLVFSYLRDLLRGKAARYVGHNPAGGAMVIALLLLLTATTVSGIALYAVDEQAGPLAHWLGGLGHAWEDALKEVHEFLANFTVLLVVVHVSGVVAGSMLHHENLVRAMVTGCKKRANPQSSGTEAMR
jgi:cytochrome b